LVCSWHPRQHRQGVKDAASTLGEWRDQANHTVCFYTAGNSGVPSHMPAPGWLCQAVGQQPTRSVCHVYFFLLSTTSIDFLILNLSFSLQSSNFDAVLKIEPDTMELLMRLFGCCQHPWGATRLYNDPSMGDEDDAALLGRNVRSSTAIPGVRAYAPGNSTVHLDLSSAGQYVVVLKNNTRICGTGGARANTPILQDKAYFEVKVQTSGSWAVGLCLSRVRFLHVFGGVLLFLGPLSDCFFCRYPYQQADLNTLRSLREQSCVWALFNDGSVWNDSVKKAHLDTPIEEGDVVGLYYDHAELTFAVNGIPAKLRLPADSSSSEPQAVVFQNGLIGIRGTVFPVFATDDGAILDTRFTSFHHPPSRASGFTEIRLEHNII
uniref:SPRY domain-containing protein 7 n=1 Tax=Schistocephalus solidus TaxID=70667 RepID=A0A183SSQ0_SCHSO